VPVSAASTRCRRSGRRGSPPARAPRGGHEGLDHRTQAAGGGDGLQAATRAPTRTCRADGAAAVIRSGMKRAGGGRHQHPCSRPRSPSGEHVHLLGRLFRGSSPGCGVDPLGPGSRGEELEVARNSHQVVPWQLLDLLVGGAADVEDDVACAASSGGPRWRPPPCTRHRDRGRSLPAPRSLEPRRACPSAWGQATRSCRAAVTVRDPTGPARSDRSFGHVRDGSRAPRQ